MSEHYVVEIAQRCPDCADKDVEGIIKMTVDQTEARCDACGEIWDIKSADEVDEREEVVELTEDEEDKAIDEVIEGEFSVEDEEGDFEEEPIYEKAPTQTPSNVESPSEPEQSQATPDGPLVKALLLSIEQLGNRIGAVESRLTDLEKVHVPEVIEPQITNIFMENTREHKIMEALLEGPKKLDEIKEVIPRNRGKAPADKTVRGWILDLDKYKKFRVFEDDESSFVLEARA